LVLLVFHSPRLGPFKKKVTSGTDKADTSLPQVT
jgi:hypothetical protein